MADAALTGTGQERENDLDTGGYLLEAARLPREEPHRVVVRTQLDASLPAPSDPFTSPLFADENDEGWNFLPDPNEKLPNEAYHGRRRAVQASRWALGVTLPVVALALVVTAVTGFLQGNPTRLPDLVVAPGTTPTTNDTGAGPVRTADTRAGDTTGHGSTPSGAPVSPAPIWSASISPWGVPQANSYEAEAAINRLFGPTVTVRDQDASGGVLIDRLGRRGGTEGAVEFTNIVVGRTGDYTLTLYAQGRADLTFEVWVNGATRPSHVLVRAHRSCCAVVRSTIALQEGANTIRVGNATAPAPALDRVVIS